LLLPLAGVLAPLIALVRMVMWSPNVPFSDEWDWTALAAGMRSGTLHWDDLWAPHNGHRELVANLMFVAVDRLGGWNVVREELVGLACIIAGLLALHRLAYRTMEPLAAGATFAVSAWLVAGPITFESALIGSNLGWPLSAAAMLIAAERLSAPSRPGRDVAVAALLAVIASFTLAPGLIVWPCGVVILFAQRAPWRTIAAWCAAWLCTFAVYFTGWTTDPSTVPFRAHSAKTALNFVLVFLGAPLRGADMTINLIAAIGALLAAAFAYAAFVTLRSPSDRERTSPWIALGAYGLIGALLTAVTRAGMGIPQALSPRYVAVSAFLLVAVIGLLLPRALTLRAPATRTGAAIVAAVLLVLVARSMELGTMLWRDFDWHRSAELQGLARNDRAAMSQSYPDPVRLEQYLDILRTVDDGPLDEK
jgi:hypothetical protein